MADGDGGAWACTVLHVDLDAFFASVEVLDDPSLAGRAVVVGGTGGRGVVASCTYEARRAGVRSAMPTAEARRRCPGAVFLPGRYGRYVELSRQFHRVLGQVTPRVEAIGLDEAFLDVAGARRLLGRPDHLAAGLRRAVADELGLACAVGVARTKLLAKLASRAAKPVPAADGVRPGPGVVTVLPAEEAAFLSTLPVRSLWGVGPATWRRLDQLGIRTVGELADVPVDTLRRLLGPAAGAQLAGLARGDDPRPVEHDRAAKSIGHEETFAVDVHDHGGLRPHLVRMADAVAARLHEAGLAGRTVTLKLRRADFALVTRSRTLAVPVDGARRILAEAGAMLDTVDVSGGVRLIGISVSALAAPGVPEQLVLDQPDGPGGWDQVEAAIAAVRARYGQRAVGPAALVGPGGLTTKGRGDTQWGPGEESDG